MSPFRACMLMPALVAAALTGCAKTPITLAPDSVQAMPSTGSGAVVQEPSARPTATADASSRPMIDSGPACSVRLADIRDSRPDANDLGMMGLRPVRSTDSVAWLRSALAKMSEDRRLRLVDDDKDAVIVLRVELVKAYIMTQNTQKSSNVVVRVTFGHDGKDLDTQIARGRDVGANWVMGSDEALGSLNRALNGAVLVVDNEAAAWCQSLNAAK